MELATTINVAAIISTDTGRKINSLRTNQQYLTPVGCYEVGQHKKANFDLTKRN
jgi:hypothetical protein